MPKAVRTWTYTLLVKSMVATTGMLHNKKPDSLKGAGITSPVATLQLASTLPAAASKSLSKEPLLCAMT